MLPKSAKTPINTHKKNPQQALSDEVWQLPKLEKIHWCIRKNFGWEPNILYAQQLKHLSLQALSSPNLPEQLPQLPNLSAISLYGMGSSGKDACPIPAVVWDCAGLKYLHIEGKPYLPFGNELLQLQALESISLRYNQWKELPKNLLLLPKLRKLQISANSFKQLPNWLPQLAALESLSLLNLKKIQNCYPLIQQMPQLKELQLDMALMTAVPKEQWLELFPNIVAAPMTKWQSEPSYFVLQRP